MGFDRVGFYGFLKSRQVVGVVIKVPDSNVGEMVAGQKYLPAGGKAGA